MDIQVLEEVLNSRTFCEYELIQEASVYIIWLTKETITL